MRCPRSPQSGLRGMAEVDVFLIGAPKAGTTWLAHVLDQHPGIVLSDPKEPNIIASHRGTFLRVEEEPDWSRYEGCFSNDGLRLDASVHTFACPMAPQRIRDRLPKARFILCLREPVSRAVSHWNMVRNTREAINNGVDWAGFESAWDDERLRVDSMYGTSMRRWLDHFELDQFIIIDSSRMKMEPLDVLQDIENFLTLGPGQYDLDMSRHSNRARSRRPMTAFGKIIGSVFSVIPGPVKLPIVRYLQKRDLNIYRLPILSRRGIMVPLDDSHYRICGEEMCGELELFESLTGFETSAWKEEIQRRLENKGITSGL